MRITSAATSIQRPAYMSVFAMARSLIKRWPKQSPSLCFSSCGFIARCVPGALRLTRRLAVSRQVDGDDVPLGRERRDHGVEGPPGEALTVQEDERFTLPRAVVREPGGARLRGREALAGHGRGGHAISFEW